MSAPVNPFAAPLLQTQQIPQCFVSHASCLLPAILAGNSHVETLDFED
jgi:hypothetical protein